MGLARLLVTSVVNHPEAVVLTAEDSDGQLLIRVACHPEDVGKVIGKEGRVIQAIRTVVRAAAGSGGVRIQLDSGHQGVTTPLV